MAAEFDKEIDALLRQTAAASRRAPLSGGAASVHLDADEISAFAENVLPATSRMNAAAHLSDCDRCRTILSGVIALNAAPEAEAVHSKPVAVEVIPWYRRLFAFPQLAYGLGALVLLFGGLTAVILFQPKEKTADVAQLDVPERSQNGKGMASDGDAAAAPEPTIANSSAASNQEPRVEDTNSSAARNPANMLSRSNTFSSSSNIAPGAGPSPGSSVPLSTSNSTGALSKSELKTQPRDTTTADTARTENSVAKPEKNPYALDGAVTKDKEEAADDKKRAAEVLGEDRMSIAATRSAPSGGTSVAAKKSAALSKSDAVETRSAGGKTFHRSGGSWVDSSFSGQSQTTVKRGTGEYLKLDAGLRSIADSLGGAVVIVWKSKAYRIQ
jgi:hypothetical protein